MKYALKPTHAAFSVLTLSMLAATTSLISPNAFAEAHPSSTPSSVEITALKRLDSLKDTPGISALKTPAVQEFRTSSGTRVLFVAAPELPIVDIRLVFDAGSARDGELKAGQYGLASLTSQLLDEGTSTQTTDQIAANFERLGAEYNAAAYRDMFTVSLRSLSDSDLLNPAVDQLLDILKDAQVPKSSFERILQQNEIGLVQQKESPSAITSIHFWRELYGHHPYAEPTIGTEESLDEIKPEDIRKFKDTYLVAHNLSIAIVGQMTLAQAQALAERISSSLPQGQAARPLPKPDATIGRTVYVPFDSTQTHVVMGQIGVTRDNPDLPALALGNEVFGGGDFTAILMKELRLKRGLTYGVYSGFNPMHSNGPFMISYSTRSDQTEESLKVTRQALHDYIQNGVPAHTLEEAKTGMLNSYPLSLSGNQNIVTILSSMGFYGLPNTYMADYPVKVAAVTPDMVKTVFNRYVHPDTMLVVVVGKEKPKELMTSADSTVKDTQPAATTP